MVKIPLYGESVPNVLSKVYSKQRDFWRSPTTRDTASNNGRAIERYGKVFADTAEHAT